jgi:hypothetical protein
MALSHAAPAVRSLKVRLRSLCLKQFLRLSFEVAVKRENKTLWQTGDAMKITEIRQHLSEKGYKTVKEWYIDGNHSYRVACFLGVQRQLAEEFKLEYNQRCGVQAINFRNYDDILGTLKGKVRTTNELRENFYTLYRCLHTNGWLSNIRADLNLTKEYRRHK